MAKMAEKVVEKVAENRDGQVSLKQMLKVLDKKVAAGVERKLKRLSKKRAVPAALDKNKADQLARKAAYSTVSKEVGEWDPVVERQRKADQLSFPLDQGRDVLPTTAESLGDLEPINDFEREIHNTLHGSEAALRDTAELSKAEEKYLKAISVDEAQARHVELQRMRVLLSSYASKMRRQKAIKSKSYRRLLKQERLRKHMKRVESNKDLLMDEIERLQKIRAKERASLKHKNTGKWAKHAKFRAKYDESARQAMMEQIGIAEKNLERPAGLSSDSDSADEEKEEDDDSDSDDEEDSDVSEDEVVLNEGNNQFIPRTQVSNMPMNLKPLKQTSTVISKEANIHEALSRAKKFAQANLSAGESGSDEEDYEQMEDEEEEDTQRKLMREAFASDDVVSEFQSEKNKLAVEEQPKDVNTFLPGWGGWAGPGIKINKRTKEKYIIKAKKVPRKDDSLGNVIISEQARSKMNDMIAKCMPKRVKNEEQFSQMLARPIASTFTSQLAHRKSIKPRIKTKMGARIEPLNKKMIARVGNKAKLAF